MMTCLIKMRLMQELLNIFFKWKAEYQPDEPLFHILRKKLAGVTKGFLKQRFGLPE